MKNALVKTGVKLTQSISSTVWSVASNIDQACQLYSFKSSFESRIDDVYVASFPRSGTTWTMYCIYQMLMDQRTKESGFDHIYQVIPWWELHGTKGLGPYLEKLPSPRIFKTHLNKYLPTEGRFVNVYRDPRDVAISLYYHNMSIGNSTHFESVFSSPNLVLGKVPIEKWLNRIGWIVKAWCEFMHQSIKEMENKDGIFISYEDMRADPRATTQTIADFLGCEKSGEEIDEILDRTSFEAMKLEEDKFSCYGNVKLTSTQSGAFVRNGSAKGWQNILSEEQKALALENMEKYFKKYNLERIPGVTRYLEQS